MVNNVTNYVALVVRVYLIAGYGWGYNELKYLLIDFTQG
jgi:hypothetical protein